jgi:hypothetical protein
LTLWFSGTTAVRFCSPHDLQGVSADPEAIVISFEVFIAMSGDFCRLGSPLTRVSEGRLRCCRNSGEDVVVGAVCRLVVVGMCLRLLCSCVGFCPVGHWVTAGVGYFGFSKSHVFCRLTEVCRCRIRWCVIVGGCCMDGWPGGCRRFNRFPSLYRVTDDRSQVAIWKHHPGRRSAGQ